MRRSWRPGAATPVAAWCSRRSTASSNANARRVRRSGWRTPDGWFADAGDRPSRAHGVIRVITERYEAERLQTVSAQRDPATGVFNRAFFVEHLARQLSLAARKNSTFAVILVGIDLAGSVDAITEDEIVEAAARMRLQMRSHEVIARYACNKFAVLLEACNETQAAAAAERLIAAVADSGAGCADAVAARGLGDRAGPWSDAAGAAAVRRGSTRGGPSADPAPSTCVTSRA